MYLLATFFCKVLRRQSPHLNLQFQLCEWVNAWAQGFACKVIALGGPMKEVGLKEVRRRMKRTLFRVKVDVKEYGGSSMEKEKNIIE